MFVALYAEVPSKQVIDYPVRQATEKNIPRSESPNIFAAVRISVNRLAGLEPRIHSRGSREGQKRRM